MKKLGLFLGIIISALLVAGCNFDKDAIIKVNGESITKQQYETTFETVVKNTPLAQIGIDMKKDIITNFF